MAEEEIEEVVVKYTLLRLGQGSEFSNWPQCIPLVQKQSYN
jgi:hypothetical protein